MRGIHSVGTGGLLLGHGTKMILLNTRALRLMGIFQRNCLLFCPRAPGSQEKRRYHQGMKTSLFGFLPRSLKDLSSILPFLLVLSRFQIQHNAGAEQNSFVIRPG